LLPALPPSDLHPSARATFPLRDDLHHGQEFVWYDGRYLLHQLAKRYQLPAKKLAEWNGLRRGEEPPVHSLIRLVKPGKAAVHVVREGETLVGIAALYQTSPRRLQRKNRMHKADYHVYIGQKLYLRKKKPRGEKIIILQWPETSTEQPEEVAGQPEPRLQPRPAPQPDTPRVEIKPWDLNPRPVPAETGAEADIPTTQPETHLVAQGETLWGISVRYATTVEILKQLNGLVSNNIQPGQVLTIRPAAPAGGRTSSRSKD
jgi:LysM repeat protein